MAASSRCPEEFELDPATWGLVPELTAEAGVSVEEDIPDQHRSVTQGGNPESTGPTKDGTEEQQPEITDADGDALGQALDVLPQTRKLFLSFLNSDDLGRCGLGEIFSHVKSKDDYWEQLDKAQGATDLLIVLVLPTFNDQPVIGRSLVSESDLYGPLSTRSCLEDLTTRVLLFTSHANKPKAEGKTVQYRGSSDTNQKPKHPALCGTEFHRWDIPWGSDLLKPSDLSRVFGAMDASGKVVTTEQIGLQHVQTSGIPSGAPMPLWRSKAGSGATVGAAEDTWASDSFTLRRSQSQPEDSENAKSSTCTSSGDGDTARNCVPPSKPGAINIALAVIISEYDKSGQRDGSNCDEKSIRDSATHLGCRKEDIHVLCPTDGGFSKDKILRFFGKVIQDYQEISIENVFIFVSGHGNEKGFKTSTEEIMQVRELVEPVLVLGGFVQLFYQACRGDNRHSTELAESKHISGLVFQSDDTSGCCLPPDLRNCAAIFACMAGYKSLRDINGSLMFQALPRAVSTPYTSVAHLAEKIQAAICVIRPGGKSNPSKEVKEQFAQIQFTDNGHLNTT